MAGQGAMLGWSMQDYGFFFVLINANVHQLFNLLPESYAGGELVVFMISFLKMYNGFLGNNGAIINNSKFYKITLPISLTMAFSVYFLNKLFYYELDLGTDGLALATLIVIFFANTFKLYFVKKKFLITPFTNKTLVHGRPRGSLIRQICVMIFM